MPGTGVDTGVLLLPQTVSGRDGSLLYRGCLGYTGSKMVCQHLKKKMSQGRSFKGGLSSRS